MFPHLPYPTYMGCFDRFPFWNPLSFVLIALCESIVPASATTVPHHFVVPNISFAFLAQGFLPCPVFWGSYDTHAFLFVKQ